MKYIAAALVILALDAGWVVFNVKHNNPNAVWLWCTTLQVCKP